MFQKLNWDLVTLANVSKAIEQSKSTESAEVENTTTGCFVELLIFAQRVVVRFHALKIVLASVEKTLMVDIMRYGDEGIVRLAWQQQRQCCSDNHKMTGVAVFTQQWPLYLSVICDGCKQALLVGVCYEMLEVPRHDLCEDCEASGNPRCFESFTKLTDPPPARVRALFRDLRWLIDESCRGHSPHSGHEGRHRTVRGV
ncbi:hypothetical protein PR003_g2929 [Phytophthora rubi]|uniref:ZZ-type domain-containing protein n=1 Tax=Phytophthora rubi TaxID=129364 RepID=A0A6A3PIQ9_9STRA|nr:hypothetical protein PR001_g461 [Phytophthora rubi]KAE9355253.1 hypothetical protein PR003_g2929 [Phytophthora rubi]